ncbi:J domain-containing protein [Lutibaculum baratangense]|nr:J domain-containing protein [Lutibaculum baratangense]
MKLDSHWFDSIRIGSARGGRGRRDSAPRQAAKARCDVPGCAEPAEYKAPKGRQRENEYHRFCLDHVREYNKSYNWFDGMSDEQVAEWLQSKATGHRPTWTMGARRGEGPPTDWSRTFRDPFGFFDDDPRRDTSQPDEPKRVVGKLERRALDALNLDETATGTEIKARYKDLVKRHHPDANGGDRSKERRLREIIEAYRTLKASGFYADS